MKNFRILFFGDVVGPKSAERLSSSLWGLRKKYNADFVIVNGENCASGNGIDKGGADMLLSGGADTITTGNHVFKRFEADNLLEDESDPQTFLHSLQERDFRSARHRDLPFSQ